MEEKSFGERLAEYRKSHFLTQKQMGDLLEVSGNHIGVLERNLKQPRASTRARFAKLVERRTVRSLGDGKPMTEAELKEYLFLLRRVNRLSPQHRQEMLDVFKSILKWF